MAPDPASRRGQHLPRPSRVDHPLRACEGRWKPTEGKSPDTALGDAPDPSRDEGAERTDRAEHGADEKVSSEPPVLSPFDMVAKPNHGRDSSNWDDAESRETQGGR